MAYTFVLNNQSIKNTYGFVLLNSGMDASRFNNNPVLLYGHNTNEVIGKWNNLTVDGDIIKADAEFDTEDEIATKLERKVKAGYLKGCSVGIIIHDMVLLAQPDGSQVPTAIKWEILEASIVPIPANAGALKLYNADGVKLTAQEIELSINDLHNKFHQIDMKEIKLDNAALAALGLDSHASAEQVNAQIVALKQQADNAAAALATEVTAKATALVDDAIANGQLLAAQKESMIAFALQNLEAAKAIIEANPKKQSLAPQVNNGGAAATDDKENWDFKQWQKQDPKGLEQLRVSDNAAYEKLRADYVAKIA